MFEMCLINMYMTQTTLAELMCLYFLDSNYDGYTFKFKILGIYVHIIYTYTYIKNPWLSKSWL